MKHIIKTVLTLSILTFIYGCQNNSVTESKTIEDAVRNYYTTMYNWQDGPNTDIKAFLNYNRDEILNTLEITEIKEIKEKDLAIAFTRYSIGTTIVRQGLWFHRIKDNWTKTGTNLLDYSYKYVGYEKKDDELKELLEEKEKWEDENPKAWWIEYIKN